MAKLLQIAQLGHPVIRKKATAVKNLVDSKFQELIDDLILTVQDVDGVGIAAPQVYESKRQFKDFVARIFQHETDHLDGIVFLDRVATSRDIITEKEYQKIVQ